jgi:hypothetical protein
MREKYDVKRHNIIYLLTVIPHLSILSLSFVQSITTSLENCLPVIFTLYSTHMPTNLSRLPCLTTSDTRALNAQPLSLNYSTSFLSLSVTNLTVTFSVLSSGGSRLKTRGASQKLGATATRRDLLNLGAKGAKAH